MQLKTIEQLKADLRLLGVSPKVSVAQLDGQAVEVKVRDWLTDYQAAELLEQFVQTELVKRGYSATIETVTSRFGQYSYISVPVLELQPAGGTYAELADAIMCTKTE